MFEAFTEEERNTMFGKAPATVWENFKSWEVYPHKLETLACDNFARRVMDSFREGALKRWALELQYRIVPDNLERVINAKALHLDSDANPLEEERWQQINALRTELGRDTDKNLSLFTQIKRALSEEDYDTASDLQVLMSKKMDELSELYYVYSHNAF